jgi:hypothetical protein
MDDRDQFEAAAARGRDAQMAGLGTSTSSGTAYFVLRQVDDQECKAFFDGVITGADLPLYSPMLTLNHRLARASKRRRGSSVDALSTTEQLYFWMRAWNAYRADQTMDRLVLPSRGVTNANFCRPV